MHAILYLAVRVAALDDEVADVRQTGGGPGIHEEVLPTHSIAAADKGQLEQHLGHTCHETRSNNRVPSLRDSSNKFVSSLFSATV
jgi:hypothetical protein